MAAHVTDAELAVLKALWEGGRSTIRDLVERLYPGGGASYYATVQKLLERLEGKGCVTRDTSRRTHSYAATVVVGDLIDRTLQDTAERLCEGSLTPLLTHLVGSARLEPQQVEELRRLVDRLDDGRNEA